MELSGHCVCLVEPGDRAALAQALRGSLWGVAGEEVCHHLSRGGQQAGAVVQVPGNRETRQGRGRETETRKQKLVVRPGWGEKEVKNKMSQISRPQGSENHLLGPLPSLQGHCPPGPHPSQVKVLSTFQGTCLVVGLTFFLLSDCAADPEVTFHTHGHELWQ